MVNKVGLPETMFLSFQHFHVFCDGGLGMVWDSNTMDDSLNVNEEEQVIGFRINITTMFNTFERASR